MPLLLTLRADAFKQSGNFNLAMEDYKQLYRLGNPAALDSMRLIFIHCNTNQKTFEEFVAALKPGNESKSVSNMAMAP